MPSLNDIANGNTTNGGCNNPNLRADQTVTILPYSPVAGCQQNGTPNPTKPSVPITIANLITDSCGTLFIDIDNSASASDANKITLGGPFHMWQNVNDGTIYSIDGYTTAAFLATLVDGPSLAVGGTIFAVDGAYGGAFVTLADRTRVTQVLVNQVFFQRLDMSVAHNQTIANTSFDPFTATIKESYELTPSGSHIWSINTTTGGGTYQDIVWDFASCGMGALPLSDFTGATFVIPGGFEGRMGICIKAVASNANFVEGCE